MAREHTLARSLARSLTPEHVHLWTCEALTHPLMGLFIPTMFVYCFAQGAAMAELREGPGRSSTRSLQRGGSAQELVVEHETQKPVNQAFQVPLWADRVWE